MPEALKAVDFDTFLAKYGLEQYRAALVDNEVDSADLVLELSEADLASLSLGAEAVQRIKQAQATPLATAVDEANPNAGNDAPATPVCHQGHGAHDIYISYQFVTEAKSAERLYESLSVSQAAQKPLCVYFDKLCTQDVSQWKLENLTEMRGLSVIIVLISEKGLASTREAHLKPDTQFLEVQHSLKLMQESVGKESSVIVQPVFMWSRETVDNESFVRKFFPDPNEFPDEPPCHELSPVFADGKAMTIQQTLRELLKLQALDAADGEALDRLVPHIRDLVAKSKK
ncbi:uncharacterized protein BJ171DRAFT_38479 [Polychytrium aggregatum]|uniref:uncharacterized protein n=1 Tax=Polychytrium aggregatum TaxID=110093 RepID=UPI0022FDF80B|nr:uncharacterized protein BJ171DRAFT_38479 [Polychytrium aggregatum]KAI9190826.1 hypothetical protein BJ171DRAFT_38479 [Polychytrium aggregatum]